MHTGSFAFARPSIGAWASYGLGTVNRNLPSFLVLAPQMPYAGTQVWAAGLPARRAPGHAGRARRGAGRQPSPPRTCRQKDRQRLELDALQAISTKSHLADPAGRRRNSSARIQLVRDGVRHAVGDCPRGASTWRRRTDSNPRLCMV